MGLQTDYWDNKMKYLQKQMAYMNLCNILDTILLFLIKR
jgi:hypothetical protein